MVWGSLKGIEMLWVCSVSAFLVETAQMKVCEHSTVKVNSNIFLDWQARCRTKDHSRWGGGSSALVTTERMSQEFPRWFVQTQDYSLFITIPFLSRSFDFCDSKQPRDSQMRQWLQQHKRGVKSTHVTEEAWVVLRVKCFKI